jgi:hypothetical protein
MEFNINDSNNSDTDTPSNEPRRYPKQKARSVQAYYQDMGATYPQPLLLIVGKANKSFFDKNSYNYLRAEGFKLDQIDFKGALEQVRWQQPAIVLLEAREPAQSDKITELLRRLYNDSLTRHIGVIVVLPHLAIPPVAAPTNVVYVTNFVQLTEAIEQLRPVTTILDQQLVTDLLPYQLNAQVQPSLTNLQEADCLQGFLEDAELRLFIDEVVNSWAVALVAAMFGDTPGVVANIEKLVEQLEIHPIEANYALHKLAQAGFIEPIETEDSDPFFTMVAHPEKTHILHKFGVATALQEYRLALITWLMSRECA